MNAFVQLILPYLLVYKYVAIFTLTLVAALAFPIPPGTLLMASAAFATQGYFSFWGVVAFGTLGNIAGDNIGYFLAYRYGRGLLRRIGFGNILDSVKYKNIEARIRRRPGFLIFISRFEVFSNLAVNLICGLGKVPYKKYIGYEVLGEFLQVLIYCSIGYVVGDNWEAISTIIGRFLLLIMLIAIVLLVIFWKPLMRRLGKGEATETEYTEELERA
jgi:membrane-associated protein